MWNTAIVPRCLDAVCRSPVDPFNWAALPMVSREILSHGPYQATSDFTFSKSVAITSPLLKKTSQ